MKPRRLIPALLCALLIAYPLSYGPVFIVYYKSGSPEPRWVEDLYSPLLWVVYSSRSQS